MTLRRVREFLFPRAAEQDPDEPLPEIVEDKLDLEPAIRDALVLEMPSIPLCRDDCEGLCAECGARLSDVDPDHSHAQPDPRWAALSALAGPPHQPKEN